jgi:ATP synthase protein I
MGGVSPNGMKSFGRYGSVGFELLAAIAIGFYGGRWIDGKLGTHWIAGIGFVLGCVAGFRSLLRTARRMERDIERDEALARGEDPWAEKPPAEPEEEARRTGEGP